MSFEEGRQGIQRGSHFIMVAVLLASNSSVSILSRALFPRSRLSDSNAAFRMSTSKGSITVEKDTLSGLSQREEDTLSFSPADRSSMTSAQREVIEVGSTVVNLTATSSGQSIGKDLGGKVTVTVKHVAADGKTRVALRRRERQQDEGRGTALQCGE